MDYKNNTIAIETVNYKSTGGIDIKIIAKLTEYCTRFCEGMEWSRKSLDTSYRLELDGKDQGLVSLRVAAQGDFVASIGKVGLNQERYRQVLDALELIKTNSEWQKKMEAEKQAAIIEEEYHQHTARVDATMNV